MMMRSEVGGDRASSSDTNKIIHDLSEGGLAVSAFARVELRRPW